MFWKLFKNQRKDAYPLTWLNSAQVKIRAWGLRISGWLQRKTNKLSPVRLKVCAAGFVLLFAGLNGRIVYQALHVRHSALPPEQLYQSHSILPSVRPPIDRSSLSGLQAFRSWLDSLQKDSAGQKIYDSIRRERPGLLDSLAQIDNRYSIHH